MGLGILSKQIILAASENKIGIFDISRIEGNDSREPKVIANAVKGLLEKGYIKRDDEGGLKLYSLTEKGIKKASSLKKQIV